VLRLRPSRPELLSQTSLEASHLSGHLAVLRSNNLVTASRKASQVSYSLAYLEVADLLTVARSLLVEILQRNQEQLDSAATLPPLRPRNRDATVAEA
jgi:DNA-binding transcriptional ArsR family regulator